MSLPNTDSPADRPSASASTDSSTQRDDSMSRRDGDDTLRPDQHRSASDFRRDESDGVNMRPPTLPPPRLPPASPLSSRGESSSSSSSSSAAQPGAYTQQLPGIRQFTRIVPEPSGDMPLDRPTEHASATYSPRIHESYRSSAPYQYDDRGSAAGRYHPDVMRGVAPPPIASSTHTERERLKELPTAPRAPSPMLPGLPQHSTENRTYQLIIRQQPQQGRLCGLGSKDKRPLDPLPILQLRILKPDGTEDEDAESSPNLVLQVSLRKQHPTSGTHAEAVLVESNDHMYPWTRMLEGRLVASANVARDLDGSRACFFVFTDLSIRQEGQFRLAFKLIALGPPTAGGGRVLAEALTEPFTIYSPRRFPGMTESTELAKCLARQGIQVPVRNDIRRKQEQVDSMTDDNRDGVE